MSEQPLEPEAEKPRHLLPEGCRDLLEWILWQESAEQSQHRPKSDVVAPTFTFQEIMLPMPGAPKRITKENRTILLPAKIWLPQPVQVGTLAARLGLKPYHLIKVLIPRKIFSVVEGWINFATAAAICAELGVVAEKEDFDSLHC